MLDDDLGVRRLPRRVLTGCAPVTCWKPCRSRSRRTAPGRRWTAGCWSAGAVNRS
ncbi:hypothetical protein HBB16_20005 [Pseudonocardia sp. MCCB 268]|nr:hypothetical protein [Pseudonocardia cytotoxica]